MTLIYEVVTCCQCCWLLIGMDKEEIMAEAQRLRTYPISIIPDQDCCTLFAPKHPATKARRADVLRAEQSRRDRRDVEARRPPRPSSIFNSCKIAARDVRQRDKNVPLVRASPREVSAGIEEKHVKFTPGKLAGMKAVSNDRGVIAAAAMDQRGSLQKALAKEKGGRR